MKRTSSIERLRHAFRHSLPLALLSVTAFAACSLVLACTAPTGDAPPDAKEADAEPAPVSTAKIEAGTLPLTLRAIGTVVAQRQQASTVRSRVAGVVSAIKVHDGDALTSGAVLIELDPRTANAQLGRAQAALELAQRELQFARSSSLDQTQSELDLAVKQAEMLAEQTRIEAERQKGMLEKGLTAQKAATDAEQAATAAAQAAAAAKSKADAYRNGGRRIDLQRVTAAVAEAEANVAQAKLEADSQTIRAALSGRVGRVVASVGQTINPGDPLIEIDPGAGAWIEFGLTPEQADQVRPGMPFTLGDDERFKGKIVSIGAGVAAETGLVPVEGSLDPGAVRPYLGQALAGQIVIGQTEQGWIVPLSALLAEDEKSFIAIVNDKSKSERIEVNVLARNLAKAAVSSPELKAGMTVISDGAYNLADDTLVADKATEEKGGKESGAASDQTTTATAAQEKP